MTGIPPTDGATGPTWPADARVATAAQPECPLVGVRARHPGLAGGRDRGHRHPADGPFHGHRCILRHGLPLDAMGRERTPGEPPWREPHRHARDVPRLPHPPGLPRTALVQGHGRHQGRDRRNPRRHLHRGEVQAASGCTWPGWCGTEYKANDSRACRGCHRFSQEVLAKQQDMVRAIHAPVLEGKATCIDCHKGVGHAAP